MFLDKELRKYIIHEDATIVEALRKIDATNGRIILVVSENYLIKGLATNGDILRWLISHPSPDLNKPILSISNKNFLYAQEGSSHDYIEGLLKKVLFVPIIDGQGRVIAVAKRRKLGEAITIGDFTIHNDGPCFVIAEIGNNHNGSLELAKELIDAAIEAGADCAKFQMRNLKALYHNAGDANDIKENLGSQYTLDLLSKFQLTQQELFEAFDYCKSKDILPLCTPWDLPSLEVLESYGMLAYKVASADFTNHELLRAIAGKGKPMICSSGMCTEEEIKASVSLLQQLGASYIVLHCNSTYPAPFSDINLRYMNRIAKIAMCFPGYSGHERGIGVSIGAAALGAKVIERHITLDRSLEGNDHKASLLPSEFKAMVRGIREVELSLGSKDSRKLSQGEMINRVNLAKSLIITRDLEKGEKIKREMVEVKSPGKGLQPMYLNDLVGRKAKHDFKKGDFFYPSDIEDELVEPRNYKFNRPWGIPVRYHDFQRLIKLTNLNLVEFHLSYKDLEIDYQQFIEEPYDIGYVVHSPELFANDHTLDLCTTDEAYRMHSIVEMQRVIDLTRGLKQYFKNVSKPLIITNVGGFTTDGFLNEQERQERYAILEDSLNKLEKTGVEIIPQTMPPFPWHFGGQQFHNLFVDPDEIVDFCKRNQSRICFDTSHSKLACTHYNWSFYEFSVKVAPFTAHLHFADSENTGGEGLQIGQGEIDFPIIARVLNDLAPRASFIPEIWQGHENNGEGFWIALERLEAIL